MYETQRRWHCLVQILRKLKLPEIQSVNWKWWCQNISCGAYAVCSTQITRFSFHIPAMHEVQRSTKKHQTGVILIIFILLHSVIAPIISVFSKGHEQPNYNFSGSSSSYIITSNGHAEQLTNCGPTLLVPTMVSALCIFLHGSVHYVICIVW